MTRAKTRPQDDLIDTWDDRASFMREVGATHATWDGEGHLLSLILTPPTPAAQRAAIPTDRPPGPAQSMAKFHEQTAARAARHHDVLFASSSMKPKFEPPPIPPSVVPRAVREREAADQGGQTKRTKR